MTELSNAALYNCIMENTKRMRESSQNFLEALGFIIKEIKNESSCLKQKLFSKIICHIRCQFKTFNEGLHNNFDNVQLGLSNKNLDI